MVFPNPSKDFETRVWRSRSWTIDTIIPIVGESLGRYKRPFWHVDVIRGKVGGFLWTVRCSVRSTYYLAVDAPLVVPVV